MNHYLTLLMQRIKQTTLGFALLFSVTNLLAADNIDTRMPLRLSSEEQTYILENMRLHLADIQSIVNALAAGDAARASKAAQNLGSQSFQSNTKRPPELIKKLPVEFMAMTKSFHQSFDTVSQGINNGEPEARILQRLGTAMNACMACHANYRIEETRR